MSCESLQVLECCFICLPSLAELKTTMTIQHLKTDVISDATGQMVPKVSKALKRKKGRGFGGALTGK